MRWAGYLMDTMKKIGALKGNPEIPGRAGLTDYFVEHSFLYDMSSQKDEMRMPMSEPNTEKRSLLFEPIKFGAVISRNRVVMAPLVTNFATIDNEISDRQITYYAERARGGAGIIVIEATVVDKAARAFERQIGVYDDRLLPGLSRLAGAIQAEGARAVLQLHHGGPKINSDIGLNPVSVSAVKVREGDLPRQLTLEELRQIRRDFVAAAGRAKRAGFDAVELHAAHFYLLSASISPYTNRRSDEYGGSTDNRARLTREIISDIRTKLGPEYPIWVRINGYEATEPGLRVEESRQVAVIFADAGADVIHVSAYTRPVTQPVDSSAALPVIGGLSKDVPPGPYLDFAKAVKEKISIPVVAVGKLDDPALAAQAIYDGKCDLVALGRQFLCDPHWPVKVQEGRKDDIIHCNYCDMCHRALYRGIDIHCAQNLNLYGRPSYKKKNER